MWNKTLAEIASKYPTGVLSYVELSGYPASVRCSLRLDEASETIYFSSLPTTAHTWRGKACILFHNHDEHLEGLRQLVIKGELVETEGQVVFKVSDFVTANGRNNTDILPHAGTPIFMLQFLMLVRKNARAYMGKRGAPWPPIPFDEIARKVSQQS